MKISGAEMMTDDPLNPSCDNQSACFSDSTSTPELTDATSSDVSDVTDDFDDDHELSEFLWQAFASEPSSLSEHLPPRGNDCSEPELMRHPLFLPDPELDALCM